MATVAVVIAVWVLCSLAAGALIASASLRRRRRSAIDRGAPGVDHRPAPSRVEQRRSAAFASRLPD
jgi:hypothetical protein